MTSKTQAIEAAGSATKLAQILGISRQAVSKWPEMIPPLQVYRLKAAKPRWFHKGGPLADASQLEPEAQS